MNTYRFPRLLVQLINSTTNGSVLGGRNTTDLHHTIQQLSVVDLNHEGAYSITDQQGRHTNRQALEDLNTNTDNIGIGNHTTVQASDIIIALVELSVTTLGHDWIISTINTSHVETLDLTNTMKSNVTSKGNSQIISTPIKDKETKHTSKQEIHHPDRQDHRSACCPHRTCQ